ncbi:MAG TPA: ABC transporter permease [Casimicrobiaceae bacterium]|jgi:ABC-type nitrate/sulfonate/bicarbonate transport system permease component|nr:ABC transporter permease [Casimicrobiaceae bacterium]
MAGHALTAAPTGRSLASPVARVRTALIVVALLAWEALAASGLVVHDVVPSLGKIASALWKLVSTAPLYANLGATLYEVGASLVIGGVTGAVVGLVLGGNRFLSRAFEPYLHYLGPTPKIIFFPIMIMWFGVGGGSKIAMGALSCFFPVALSTAVGMRQIEPVLVRVGKSFRATTAQMVAKIYLPAIRPAMLTGLRLGLGVAVIGVLLAETKLSNRGLGYLVIQRYTTFDMPGMYALLIVVFLLAIVANALLTRWSGDSVR